MRGGRSILLAGCCGGRGEVTAHCGVVTPPDPLLPLRGGEEKEKYLLTLRKGEEKHLLTLRRGEEKEKYLLTLRKGEEEKHLLPLRGEKKKYLFR